MATKPFTQAKAKKILREKRPTLKGEPITKEQRGMLGLIAGGETPTRLKKGKEWYQAQYKKRKK